MWRILPLVMLASSVLAEDPIELVRRARVREDHENREGARVLLEQALMMDPSCGAALERLAWFDGSEGVESRLRYLTQARPLDLDTARKFLRDLAGIVIVLPDELCHRIERAALSPPGSEARTCGPWLPWERPWAPAEALSACGPLRQEASGSLGRRHAEGLLEVEGRLDREGITDVECWAPLAVALHRVRDADGARRCLARARPVTLDERISCVMAAMAVSDDPFSWWRLHGEAFIEDAVGQGPAKEQLLIRLSHYARRALEADRDLLGLVRLAIAEMETASVGSGFAGSKSLATILTHWFPDEALPALQDLPGPGAACLRAHLLAEMLQEDAALSLLEETVKSNPSYLPAWTELFLLRDKCDLATSALEAGKRAFQGAIEARAPVDPRWLRRYVELLAACGRTEEVVSVTRQAATTSTWPQCLAALRGIKPRAIPSADLVRALREDLPKSEWFWTHLSTCFTIAPDAETIAWVLDELRRRGPHTRWPSWREFEIHGFRHALLRARVLASRDTLSEMEDQLARQLFRPSSPDYDVPELLVRLRVEIEADAEFLALPGAAYVVSLLLDGQLQVEQARLWRKKAFASGFRSPGLVFDMIADGEPVLDELARLNPLAARLEEALRSSDPDRLRAFLEEDEATSSAIRHARHALVRQTGEWTEAAILDDESLFGAAKRRWALLQTSLRQAEWALHNQAAELHASADLRKMTLEQLLERTDPDDVDDAEWLRAARERVREGGQEALSRILDRPQGPSIAAELVSSSSPGPLDAHLTVLRTLEERHSRDLRWAWARAQIAAQHELNDEAGQALSRVRAGRTRSARFFLETMELPVGRDVGLGALAEYLRLRNDASPWDLASSLDIVASSPLGKEIGAELLSALLARCGDDSERPRMADLARSLGLDEEERAILAALGDSKDRRVRYGVHAWRRSHSLDPEDVDESLALAAESGWTDLQAVELWARASAQAAAAGREEEALDALHEVWNHGFVRREGTSPYEVATSFVNFGFQKTVPLVDLVSKHLEDANPPPWLPHVAASIFRFSPDARFRQVVVRSYELGAATRQGWIEWAASRPEGQTLTECRQFLRGAREGPDAYEAGYVILRLANRLFEGDRTEEAVECLHAWAERCGPFGWLDHQGPGPYMPLDGWDDCPFPPLYAFEGDLRPPSVLVGLALCHGWRPREAHAEFERALAETWTPGVREGCLRAMAAIELEVVLPDAPPSVEERREARTWGQAPDDLRSEFTRKCVPTLLRVMREDRSADMRREAYVRLQRVYRDYPSTRPDFVDDLLSRTEDSRPPEPSELNRWKDLLAGADPSERERAEAELGKAGLGALSVLRALLRSSDPEAAARAEAILEELAAP